MKHLNSIVSAALAGSLLLTGIPASADVWVGPDDNTPTSGTCGENLTWEYDRDTRVMTISGTGGMKDYTADDITPWWPFAAEIVTVEIADGVTSIGDLGFYGCDEIVSIQIPDSVTSIGERAFDTCYALERIDIPESVTTIGNAAFAASGLTEVVLPASITEIGEQWSYGCQKLGDVVIPDSITYIADEAFLWSALKTVVIPESVTEISESAFFMCSELTTAAIHAKSVGEYAFGYCMSLKNLDLTGVEHIGEMAFARCEALENITLPQSVQRIDGGAFAQCASLQTVTVVNDTCEFYEGNIPEGYDGRMTICNDAEEIDGVMTPYFNGSILCRAGSTAYEYATKYGYTVNIVGGAAEPLALGDVNGDGVTDASDAAEILAESARLGSNSSTFSEEQNSAADVNGDGELDASDAAAILAYAAAVGSGNKDAVLEDFI